MLQMFFEPKNNLILKVKHGSHAYGLNTPESDIDYKAICIEPFEYILSFINKFEQLEEHASKGFDGDQTIFSLKKFMPLAANNNPNCIEILFVEPEDIVYINDFGKELILIREKFLSKKSYFTFGSYAKSQLKRLENHRKWILKTPSNPTRKEFGLPEVSIINSDQKKAAFSAIQKKLDHWNFKDMSEQDKSLRIEFSLIMSDILTELNLSSDEQWNAAGRYLGFETNFLLELDKERKYKNAQEEHKNYLEWQLKRNKKRYETEKECLVDTKHSSHLVRLYFECIDILKGNSLILKRPKEERELLLAIKQGKFGKETYNEVKKLQIELQEKCDLALLESKIPEKADSEFIDNFMREMYLKYWKL